MPFSTVCNYPFCVYNNLLLIILNDIKSGKNDGFTIGYTSNNSAANIMLGIYMNVLSKYYDHQVEKYICANFGKDNR